MTLQRSLFDEPEPGPPAGRRLLVTSASPARLEAALCQDVLVRREVPVLLVVPTRHLADRVRSALMAAAPGGVVAGVEIAHHRRVAERVLEVAHVLRLAPAPPGVLPAPALNRVVAGAVTALPEHAPMRRLADERERALPSLARTLGELREAGVRPDEVAAAGDPVMASTLEAYERSVARIERELGLTDAAGHARAATAAARALARAGRLPWGEVLHHGAYELVAAQAELVEAVADGRPLRVYAPCGQGAAFAAAHAALAVWPGSPCDRRDLDAESAAPPTPLDLAALFDDERTARPAAQGTLEAFTVRGARAEVELAARLAAEAHAARSVPLEEIGVLARTLEPFAAHVADAFAAQGVPFTTTVSAPLTREPWAQAFLVLLEALAEDLPRAAVLELLRSPAARLPEGAVPDLWDAWTRAAGVTSGRRAYDDVLGWHVADLREQSRRLERDVASQPWVERREARLRQLLEVVDGLEAERVAWSRCATRLEHAAWLEGLVARWLRPPAELRAGRPGASLAREGVLAALADVATAGRVDGSDAAAVDARAVRRELRDALAGTGTRLGTRDGSGVRVLPLMPARGIPFREVIVIGVEQGVLPRRPRQDPFLRDEVREKLRARRPSVAIKGQGVSEERLLLALALGASTGRTSLAWQRADQDGRTRAPSLHLREMARVATGVPDVAVLFDEPRRDPRLPLTVVPAHPASAARLLRLRSGRTTWRDALVEIAERRERRAAVARLAELADRPVAALDRALAKIQVVDAFRLDELPDAGAALAHDGVLGAGVVPLPEPMSATSLEAFGRCGLRWLLERGLRIDELVDPPPPESIAASELGSLVHAVLEETYADVIGRGGGAEAVRDPRTRELLRAAFDRRFHESCGRRRESLPLCYDAAARRWRESLETFLDEDAARLQAEGARVVEVEREVVEDVVVGIGGSRQAWKLRGRFDRLLATRDGWRVEDFKTGRGRMGKLVAMANVLKGHELQGVAYLLLGRAWADAHEHPALGSGAPVSVSFVPLHPDTQDREPVSMDEEDARFVASAAETLGVLRGLLSEGAFPLRPPESCRYCACKPACRRTHAPTELRLLAWPGLADHRDLGGKSSQAWTLADVRAKRGAP